jgi:hypothetical protein
VACKNKSYWGLLKELNLESKMGSAATSNGERRVTAVQKLRSMLADPEQFIACPGVYDGFTAQIALREGVDCLYMVSSILSHLQFDFDNLSNTTNNLIVDWCRNNNVSARSG